MTKQTIRPARPFRALALTVAPGALCLAPPAFAKTEAGLNVALSATVASNPDVLNNAKVGVSGVATVTPWIRFDNDLSHIGLMGNVQVEKFTNTYGTNVSGWASADAELKLSDYVTISGSLAYRRTKRILDDFLARGAGGLTGANGDVGEVLLPTNPLPDVSFGALRTRNESYEGNVNLSVLPSERGQLSLGLGLRAARYGTVIASDLNTYTAFTGYRHRLSERTSLNANVSVTRYDFLGTGSGDGWTVTPRVGASQQLGETLTLSGSIGSSISRTRRPDGSIRSFALLSGELSLCKTAQRTKYCLSADRSAESAVLGGASASTQVKFNLATTVGERDSLTADVFYSRSDSPTVSTVVGRVSEFVGASASFSHNFPGRRLNAFVTPSVVRLKDSNGAKTNFQVRVGLSYSFGGRS